MGEFEDKVIKELTEIKQVLKGYNGNTGLCKQVECNTKMINKIWIAIAIIAASTGGGAYGIIQFILR